MTQVAKAYSLNAKHKVVALMLYKQALNELVETHGAWQCSNAHTQLSANFGVKWLEYNFKGTRLAYEDYAAANNAFNYANLTLGIEERFLKTAQEVLEDNYGLNLQWLSAAAKQMNCLLTNV
jgi:hypothetical protein